VNGELAVVAAVCIDSRSVVEALEGQVHRESDGIVRARARVKKIITPVSWPADKPADLALTQYSDY
jgi:hypothetical protein